MLFDNKLLFITLPPSQKVVMKNLYDTTLSHSIQCIGQTKAAPTYVLLHSVDLILIQPNISSDTQVTLARAKLFLCLPVLYKKCTLAYYKRCTSKKKISSLYIHIKSLLNWRVTSLFYVLTVSQVRLA